ncbi:MAG: HyaD/HybD family hydrogenase maturation endopeptidase [Archaeoglobaceae archaeon]|nr:HyaD/HybD family hydrogenase maturation endopeptidase [Archaeoglobaceae archaeon]MCX8152413.1 HyaD/HybD family hydrogenase maturation endopeptidase [Archaeoglobaceae archaeon]MDW8013753.1 HyaD/HybD family hydrogenase maturation endopeptidase [Archaeoglobaceae archaeon]
MIELSLLKEKKAEKIAVVGVGNLLLGDEGFGVHVLNRLKSLPLPENVEIYEYGVAGLKILRVFDEADKVIFIDAIKLGKKPGTIYVLSMNFDDESAVDRIVKMQSLHDLDLTTTLSIAKLAGFKVPREIVVLGVEPKEIEPKIGLSKEVEEALPKVVEILLNIFNSVQKVTCDSNLA